MRPRLLILAGTTEASALARRAAEAGVEGILSYAGRVAHLPPQPLPVRVGGFGGATGLSEYLAREAITHLVDATHPFASAMSHNAAEAAARTGVAHAVLTRPAWLPVPGDRWIRVPDMAGAVAALDRPRARVLLAIGRMHLARFAVHEHHFYLLRLVDPPDGPLPFPEAKVIVDRGPFDEDTDRATMERYGIDLVVSKNSGGPGAHAKIAAARALGVPVIMIDRPAQPEALTFQDADGVLDWVTHGPAQRGV